MNPPAWFTEELAKFDPGLRVRWSAQRQMWALERQVKRALHPGTLNGDTEDDEYVRARDGFLLVGHIPPRGISRYVFQTLEQNDMWKRGGWERYIREVEDAEESADEEKWRKITAQNRDLAKDLYEVLKLRSGRTVFNAGTLG